MDVVVVGTGESTSVRWEGAQDLASLSVSTPAGTPARDVDAALRAAGAGHLDADGEHARLRVAWLRGHDDDPGWRAGFDATIAYAASKGWVDEDGTTVRAHVRRT